MCVRILNVHLKIVMAAASLVAYAGSSDEDEVGEGAEPSTPTKIDYTKSSKILSSLKDRVSIDSTPSVPNKVGGVFFLITLQT